MDSELKTSSWDFTESSREDEASLAAIAGSSSSLGVGVHKNAGKFSVDLKLGGLGDFGNGPVDKLKEPRGSRIVPSPSGSSKKTRAAINGTQNVSCLVDGCTANLSNCREYHRRHRVCEGHSKTPVVVVRGKEQRFCQQCSRFQSLGEFDEEKRSCRKRLEGHNRRRRKSQPEAFDMSFGNISSNHQGARLLQFSGPQSYTTSTAGSVPSWPRVVKQHQELHIIDQQSAVPNSLACVYNGGDKRFPFLLTNDPERSNQNQAVPDVPLCQRLVNDHGHQKVFSNGFTQSVNPKRALSLLSTYPTPSIHPTETLGTSFSQLVQRDVMNPNQPIGSNLHFDGLVQTSRSQGRGARPPVLVPPASNHNNPCNEIFQVVPDDMLETEASQLLLFSWK